MRLVCAAAFRTQALRLQYEEVSRRPPAGSSPWSWKPTVFLSPRALPRRHLHEEGVKLSMTVKCNVTFNTFNITDNTSDLCRKRGAPIGPQ